MELTIAVIGVLAAVLAAGAAVWSFLALSRAQTRASIVEAQAESLRAQAAQAEARAQEAAAESRRQITDLSQRFEEASAERHRLRTELAEEQARHEASVRNATTAAMGLDAAHEQQVRGLMSSHEEKLKGLAAAFEEERRGILAKTRAEVEGIAQRERVFREEMDAREKQMETRVREAFAALSQTALKGVSDEFLKVAELRMSQQREVAAAELDKRREAVDVLVKPIAESLKKTDEKLEAFSRNWSTDKATLDTQLRTLAERGDQLRAETGRLVRALRDPQVRGRYGEVQLKRVAELAGMREYCDFSQQDQTRDEEGNALRPDMRVTLPSGRVIAIDAKANLKAYLDAMEEPDPDKVEGHLREFADGVARQAVALSKRGYWKQYDDSPEMVLMFIPGDQFVDAAYSKRPDLLELAARHRVVIASPSTLIALLHAVHMGYEEQKLAREAQELRKLGQELHLRAVKAMDFVAKLGDNLEKANKAYNDFVASYQTRLEPTLRKFQEGGATSGKELPTLTPIDATPRLLPGSVQRDEA